MGRGEGGRGRGHGVVEKVEAEVGAKDGFEEGLGNFKKILNFGVQS